MNLKLRNNSKKSKNNASGITLVALVVTIVVLLILAGISLNLVLGSNGIIAKAKNAKNQTEQDKINTETALNSLFDEMVAAEGGSSNSGGNGGNRPTGGNWDEILAYANAHPEDYKLKEQKESTAIGIGTDGEPVNMDLWYCSANSNNTIKLSAQPFIAPSTWGLVGPIPAYRGDCNDGKIQGAVPQYVKIDSEHEFLPVTDMDWAFCQKNLTSAPKIPNTVTNMSDTFANCTNLTIAPEIPNSVTSMSGTFYNCTGLTSAPTIPSNVTYIGRTFYNCTNLTGELVINAINLSDPYGDGTPPYEGCLSGAATAGGCDLKLSGSCNVLQAILDTASENSHISLK